MRGSSVGEKIGEGAYADVHAWAPGQVVKLFKAGFPRRHSWWETRMTRAVFAAGAPAPEVFDEVTLEGRFGVVLQRLDGPTLLQLSRSGAMTSEQVGSILATVAISVHKTPAPPDVLSLRDTMAGSSRLSGGMLPRHIATGILTLIERLVPGDGLCHGDLHPGNVIMTTDGPRIIDWGVRPVLPLASTLRAVTSSFAISPRKRSPIRSGHAQSMRPRSPSTRGWPACPQRR
jgi:Ser/Thr protein kinase RdoA (MazF antagonist)